MSAVQTNIEFTIVETDDNTKVSFVKGQYIIEDGSAVYYDPTTGSTVSDRIELGSADINALKQQIVNIPEMQDEIANIQSELMDSTYVDVTSDVTWNINGYYTNGDLSGTRQATSTAKTAIFTVYEGEKYKIWGISNYGQKLICCYASDNSILLQYSPNYEYRLYSGLDITVPAGTVKMGISYYDASALAEFLLYKEKYIAKDYAINGEIGKDDVTFIDVNTNVNLFDKSTAVDNYYLNTSTGLPTSYSGMFYAYVPISEAGYYSLIVLRNFFGPVNAFRVHLYNSAFTKIATVTATETGGSGNLTQAKIYVTANHILQGVKYIGINGNISNKNVIMTVKGEAYPSIYTPYFTPYYTLNDSVLTESHNPLFKKVTVFDGDSIANGSSAADGSSGWASRIGAKNKMSWRNYAVGGGCITYISGKHCISRDIDTIHNSYPTLDYLILEGGTNDADNLYSDPTKIGTIDPTDYSGTYDDTTFCGALDALFYKALNYYPTAKIGFIVAQKMGTSNVEWTHRKQFFTLAMQACEKWGIPYLNLWDGSPLNPLLPSMYDSNLDAQGNRDGGYLYTDGQHLTATGYDVITPKIEAWMKTL